FTLRVGSTQYQVGETLTFNKIGGGTVASVVEDVFPPINGGTALSVQAIYYFSGNTGLCVIVPSQLQVGANNQQFDKNGNPLPLLPFLPGQIAGLRRGSLIQIAGEAVMVLVVRTGPQGQLAIGAVTTVTHAPGETIVGLPAIACSGVSNLVNG